MGKIEKISAGMSAFAQSLASLAKVALLSRRPSVAVTAGKDEELVVLGNGPSLNDTVADHSDFLASRRLLAVNFAANTPLFRQLKPDYLQSAGQSRRGSAVGRYRLRRLEDDAYGASEGCRS